MSDKDKMRAEFEKWASIYGFDLQRSVDDWYFCLETRSEWITWQAAYQSGQKAEREAICIQWEGADATIAEVERLRAELAAAKAASVVPEESVIWLLAVAAKLEKDGESSRLDSITKAAIWLRERMKDKTPPQA